MDKIFSKLFAIVLVVLLVFNMFFYGMGKIDLVFFWINLLIIGAFSFMMYGDKSKLKNIFG